MSMSKFTIFRGSNLNYYFNFKASNGEIILQSEGYSTWTSCRDGISSVKANAQYDFRYQRLVSVNGMYYFTLRAANNQVIGVSQMYASSQGMENGIRVVKTEAPSAPIEDLT
jgi:uncharacterized protein